MSDDAGGEAVADNLLVTSNTHRGASDLHDQRGGWPAAILLAATFFAAIAPTLSWLEFSSSMENLVVATSLEIRRTQQWLLPQLEGQPRVAKPPLAAWISAAAIRSSTDIAIDSRDTPVREAAYRNLAWETRWPGLACSCLMLLAIFHMGRTVLGVRGGLLTMAVAGSSLFFFRFGRQSTTDVQLALWTSVANAALVRICLRGVSWPSALTAGAALGLGFMSKGPVVFVESIMPAAIFTWWHQPRPRLKVAPLAVGLLVMLAVGLPWYALVVMRVPEVWQKWAIEIPRTTPENRAGTPLSYFSLLANMLPWTPLLVHALIWTGVDAVHIARRRAPWSGRAPFVLMLLLIVIPVFVLAFFPDRKERYVLPLIGACSVLVVRSLELTLRGAPGKIPAWAQWTVLVCIGIGVPIAGTTMLMQRIDGRPVYTIPFAVGVVVLMAVAIGGCMLASRRRPAMLVVATVAVMLIMQPVLYYGYRDMRSGQSELQPLAEHIRATYPDAVMWNWRPGANKRVPVDLAIYLNRSVIWTADPTTLPASPLPQVAIKLQNHGEPEPVPPSGWKYFDKIERDKDWYWAFVREGSHE